MACQYLLKQWWKCWKEYMNYSIYKTKCMIGLYNPSLTCPNKKGFFYIPLNNIVIGIFCYPNCSLFRAISATYSFKIAGYRPNRFHLKHWIVSKRNTGIYRSVMYCILDDGVRHYHPSWIFTKGLQLAISSGVLVLYVGLVFDRMVVSNICTFPCRLVITALNDRKSTILIKIRHMRQVIGNIVKCTSLQSLLSIWPAKMNSTVLD